MDNPGPCLSGLGKGGCDSFDRQKREAGNPRFAISGADKACAILGR